MLKAIKPMKTYTRRNVGHWVAIENEEMEVVGYYCSACDLPLETEERTPFCPQCGARMRKEVEE